MPPSRFRIPPYRLLGAIVAALLLGGAALIIAAASGSRARPGAEAHRAWTFPPLVAETPLPATGPGARTATGLTQAAELARQRAILRNARLHVARSAAAGYRPLYAEAQRAFGINWLLVASIHRQETAFSTAPGTYHGRNFLGCCAGPMQFNLANGPVSTWDLFNDAFRSARRPERYPHATEHHPSIYDDFDAITAAGRLLQDSGAGQALDGTAWQAAYNYYGHDLFGVDYANQVLARAIGWSQHGFCPNCGPDPGIVAALEAAYGGYARAQLEAEARAERRHKRKHKKRHKKRARRHHGARDEHAERWRRPPSRPKEPSARRPAPKPAPAPAPQEQPQTTETTTAPPAEQPPQDGSGLPPIEPLP